MAALDLNYWKETLAKNEDRIILIVGFILVAFLSFGAGKLSETYHPQTPIVFKDAPKCGTANNGAKTANSAVSDSANNQGSQTASTNREEAQGRIIGNKKSMIYHVPGDAFYDKIGAQNRVYFNSEAEAQKSGFRKSR